ncbi:MAG: PQQ-binding-like beta-propeller repeat protein [Gemmataceae bacterium]
MRLLTTLSLVLACVLTLGLLPYAWARTSVMPMITGRVEPMWAGALAAGIVAVFALSWRRRLMISRFTWRWIIVLMAFGWLGTLGALAAYQSAPVPHLSSFIALFLLSSLWVPAGAWLGYAGAPANWRLLVVLVLLCAGLVFPFSARVDGLQGDGSLELAWRNVPRRDGRASRNETPTLPPMALSDLTPDDSPQFFGLNRNGISSLRLADWAGDLMPHEIWRREIGSGWSGFAAIGGYAITQEQLGPDECVSCYRMSDSALVWRHATRTRFDCIVAGDGPRATPVIDAGRLYAVGATGHLACLNAASGKPMWSAHVSESGSTLEHGLCASPLIDGNRVIVCSADGASLAAFDKCTGDRLWSAITERAGYSSPVIWEVDGSRQIVVHNAQGLAGHDAATGKSLWLFPWTNECGINFSQPIPDAGGPGTAFVSTGFASGGCALIRVKRDGPDRWTAEPVWRSKSLRTKFTSAVLFEGHLYGLDDGVLACVEAATGKVKWREGKYQHGQVILVGDRLLVQAEAGDVVMVDPSPNGLREVARIPALSSKTWTVPCVVAGHLLVRNDREAVCYELPGK